MKRYVLVENTNGRPSGLRILGEADSLKVSNRPMAATIDYTLRGSVEQNAKGETLEERMKS